MAAKKDEKLEVVETPEVAENQQPVVPDAQAAPATQPENTELATVTEPIPDTPQSLDALAAKHRVPAWQAAALDRFMGWESGKLVTEADFVVALHSLDARRMGGGRKE